MELYRVSNGFVIDVNGDQSRIRYVSRLGLSCGIIDKNQEQTLLLKLSDFDRSAKFHDGKLCIGHANSNPVVFSYDKISRNIICQCTDDSGKMRMFKVKSITTKQLWLDEHPGPTTTLCVKDVSANPFKDLHYVYHDGSVKLSIPSQIDIIVPEDKVDMVKSYAASKGISIDNLKD